MTGPHITITYCTQCSWLLRANWMAAELLSTFGAELESVTLVPGTGGIFVITAGVEGGADQQIWERKADGGFPDAPELKRRVRDAVLPDWSLGHSDKPRHPQTPTS